MYIILERTIRLVGSENPLEGRVQVFMHGVWGNIYINYGRWTSQEGEVVCRQLGLGRFVETFYSPSSIDNFFIMIRVRCAGDELFIQDCDHDASFNVGNFYTSYGHAGVKCQPQGNIYCPVLNHKLLKCLFSIECKMEIDEQKELSRSSP